jgi:hypothetical protein
MLNRSNIVIDVEPFFCSDIPHSLDAAQPHARTEVAVKRPRQLSAANAGRAPRRTAPFPNGDVGDGAALRRAETL